MKAYEIRDCLWLQNYDTEITREDFEELFTRTDERVAFTFCGWDGKSYNGESRTARVYRTTIKGCESQRFVKVGKSLHLIDEERMVTEKATGEKHHPVNWLVNVARATRE